MAAKNSQNELKENLANSFRLVGDSLRTAKHNIATQFGLNSSEYEVLVSVYNNETPPSIKQLSADLLLCSQAVTKICKNLQSLGLITSHKSGEDRRVTLIKLTDNGQKMAIREKEFRQKVLGAAFGGLTAAELQQVTNTLNALSNAADEILGF